MKCLLRAHRTPCEAITFTHVQFIILRIISCNIWLCCYSGWICFCFPFKSWVTLWIRYIRLSSVFCNFIEAVRHTAQNRFKTASKDTSTDTLLPLSIQCRKQLVGTADTWRLWQKEIFAELFPSQCKRLFDCLFSVSQQTKRKRHPTTPAYLTLVNLRSEEWHNP